MVEQIIYIIVGVVFTAVAGGLQHKMHKIEEKLQEKVSRDEVKDLLEANLRVLDVQVIDIKEDLITINRKLDKLIEQK